MNKLYQAFLTYIRCELNLSAHTVLAYTYDLRQWQTFVEHTFNHVLDPLQVTANDIRLWVAHLASTGHSQRTIRRKIQTLRALYEYLMRRHGAPVNPAAEIVGARLPRHLPGVVAPADTARVLDADYDATDFTEVRDRLLVDMLYSTGMRASEIATLTVNNINQATGELKVLGKRNKERIIPYGPEIRQMIRQYMPLRPEGSADTLFVREDGRPLEYRHVNAIVKAQFATSSGAKPTPHTMRHSFATDMLNGGASLTSVQALLGHASLATTQIYTHLSYSELKHNYELAHPRAQKKG